MRDFRRLGLIFLSLMTALLVSCAGDESNVANENLAEDTSDLDAADIVFSGSLSGQNGYQSTGEVSMYYNADSDQYTLLLENFSSDDGPALFVYLSQGRFASNFTNLGALKSLNGTIRYDFPASQFNANFDHVLIWCDRVSQSFGEAMLVP